MIIILISDVLPSEVESSCASVSVIANSPGFSEIEVLYTSTSGALKASTMIAAYKPLVPLNPSSGSTILTPGASRIVLFEGGPLPWISKTSGHYTKGYFQFLYS